MNFSYSIVIVTYNRLELLKDCLEHACNQTVKPQKIIVVNNCSTDGTKEYLEMTYRANEHFIISHEKENLGGAGGFKRGLLLAMESGIEWIMLIDDDAILEYSCMEYLNPLVAKNKTLAYACTVMCNNEIDISHRRNYESAITKDRYDENEFVCELATFCGLMVNRELVCKIGYPKAEYFIWCDDTEYSMRINKSSRIVVITKACLNHKIKMADLYASQAVFTWKSYYGMRNTIDMLYCHHHQWKLFKICLQIIREILICFIKSLSDADYKAKSKMLCNAFYDGVTGKLGKDVRYLPGQYVNKGE